MNPGPPGQMTQLHLNYNADTIDYLCLHYYGIFHLLP